MDEYIYATRISSFIVIISKTKIKKYDFDFHSYMFRSRRPVPSLTNPMGNGNGNATNNGLNQTLMLGNGNLSISQAKKNSSLSTQNNYFPFMQTSTNQNKYNNIQTPLVSSLSNTHQRAPVMTNYIQTQNKQSPPPPPHIMNGNDMEPNFPSMNVRTTNQKQLSLLTVFTFLFFLILSLMMHMT